MVDEPDAKLLRYEADLISRFNAKESASGVIERFLTLPDCRFGVSEAHQ